MRENGSNLWCQLQSEGQRPSYGGTESRPEPGRRQREPVDDSKFGADAAEQELSLTLLAAVWKSACRCKNTSLLGRARMEEDPTKIPEIPGEEHAEFREIFVNQHPDIVLTYMREPHRKFVERVHRDYMVHGAVAFYEVDEMRTRSDRVVQTSGFSKTSDDLLRVVQHDNKVSVTPEGDVMDRIHSF